MPTIFSRIIEGELPGTFVWRDDLVVAFLSINPLKPGHTLVVPRVETDHWLDLDLAVAQHCMVVSQFIGKAQQAAFNPTRIALLILGMEVPHVHVHVLPIWAESDVNFAERRPLRRSRRSRARRRSDPHRAPRPRPRRGQRIATASSRFGLR